MSALAELEVFHSRPFSPTRRVALGAWNLPAAPAPEFGAILLAGVVAAHIDGLDPELLLDLDRLIDQVALGRRVVQPRLRHRFQTDHVGLARTRHALVGAGEELEFEFTENNVPVPQVLAAVYVAGRLPLDSRRRACELLHAAARWRGPIGPSFLASLNGRGRRLSTLRAFAEPEVWAMEVLGMELGEPYPNRRSIQERFRTLVRAAHPDSGGDSDAAAKRILDLTEARRILLELRRS